MKDNKTDLKRQLELLEALEMAEKAQYIMFSGNEGEDRYELFGKVESPVTRNMFAEAMTRAQLTEKCNKLGIRPLIITFADLSKP